jgi:hypothetical protein
MTTFSASLTNLTALLPLSRDCSCYVCRQMLAPPPLWFQKHTNLRAHDFAHSAHLRYQPRLANVTCVWSWRLYGINPAVQWYIATKVPEHLHACIIRVLQGEIIEYFDMMLCTLVCIYQSFRGDACFCFQGGSKKKNGVLWHMTSGDLLHQCSG